MQRSRVERRNLNAVTIDDVAALAGVSIMSVSRVLNKKPGVSAETRTRIEDAIRTLNYVPSTAARGLASAITCRIGLLYMRPEGAYMSAFLAGVLDEIGQWSGTLSTRRCDDITEARACIESLLTEGVDGVILAPPFCDMEPLRRCLLDAGRAVVAVGVVEPVSDVHCVGIDEYSATQDMTRYLLSQGHRRIGFIIGDPGQTGKSLRFEGFRDELAKALLQPAAVETGDYSFKSGIGAAQRMLARPAERPTAIFAGNDDMASATVSVAHSLGLRVPEDLSVVGFDNTLLASATWPELTTVSQPISAMASTAVQTMVKAVLAGRFDRNTSPMTITMDVEIVVRSSVASVAGSTSMAGLET